MWEKLQTHSLTHHFHFDLGAEFKDFQALKYSHSL